MIAAQRSAAEQAGVAFWNTFDAMGGHNSMVRFVERRWAAKDYTHIGYTGGKYVADRLVDALVTGIDSMRREIELRERIDRLLKYYSGCDRFQGSRHGFAPAAFPLTGSPILGSPFAGREHVAETGPVRTDSHVSSA